MSLSDRLEKARTQRLIESGELPSEFALKPDGEVEPEPIEDAWQELEPPVRIEVQPTGLHLVAEASPGLTQLPAGHPASICPNCNAIGHLDMVDLVGHTVHLTCKTCGTMWQVRNSVDQTIIN